MFRRFLAGSGDVAEGFLPSGLERRGVILVCSLWEGVFWDDDWRSECFVVMSKRGYDKCGMCWSEYIFVKCNLKY